MPRLVYILPSLSPLTRGTGRLPHPPVSSQALPLPWASGPAAAAPSYSNTLSPARFRTRLRGPVPEVGSAACSTRAMRQRPHVRCDALSSQRAAPFPGGHGAVIQGGHSAPRSLSRVFSQQMNERGAGSEGRDSSFPGSSPSTPPPSSQGALQPPELTRFSVTEPCDLEKPLSQEVDVSKSCLFRSPWVGGDEDHFHRGHPVASHAALHAARARGRGAPRAAA